MTPLQEAIYKLLQDRQQWSLPNVVRYLWKNGGHYEHNVRAAMWSLVDKQLVRCNRDFSFELGEAIPSNES